MFKIADLRFSILLPFDTNPGLFDFTKIRCGKIRMLRGVPATGY